MISAGNQQERLLEVSTDYIVGLVDGEGYFSVSPRIRMIRNREVKEIDCVFGIDLKEEDRPILERVQYSFQCGTLYYRKDDRKNFCNLWSYRVRSHQDLLTKIIPFFERNSLQFPSKSRSFNLFRQILLSIQQGKHQTERGFMEIQELVTLSRILRGHTPSSFVKKDEDMVHAL